MADSQTIVDAGSEGYRMLYIAMTRTTHYLDIVHPAESFPQSSRRPRLSRSAT